VLVAHRALIVVVAASNVCSDHYKLPLNLRADDPRSQQ